MGIKVFSVFVIFTLTLLSVVQGSELPLIYHHNMVYLGAFKTPVGDDMSYGGGVIAFNPSNGNLFISGNVNEQKIGEISVPAPVISDNLTLLNRATLTQNFYDITEGNRDLIRADGTALADGNGSRIGGLLTYDGGLIGTIFAFYNTAGARSHFKSGFTLSTAGDFGGIYTLGPWTDPETSSFVNGWMAAVPSALSAELVGPVITGNGSLSILSRTSYGPAAFYFDPSDLGVTNPVTAEPLLYYDQAHQTLNPGGYSNPTWNDTTKQAGIAVVGGSRSVLFFGYHGLGERNYGGYSANPIFADECQSPDTCITGPKGWQVCENMDNCTTGRKGIPYDNHVDCSTHVSGGSDGCYYDPTGMGDKGPHAPPYRYQVWAYDANDLAAVKNGTLQPWEPEPYAIWELPIGFSSTAVFGGATAYDPATGKLYVSQPQGESSGYNRLPVIHVFQINMLTTPPTVFLIKGKAMLFEGTLNIKNNGGDMVTITATSRTELKAFTFPGALAAGASYNITVSQQPAGYNCVVLHGSGTVDDFADITETVIDCEKIYSGAPTPGPWQQAAFTFGTAPMEFVNQE